MKDICRSNIDALVGELQERGCSGNLNGTHLPVMICGREALTFDYVDIKGNARQQKLPKLPSSFDALTKNVIKGAWEKTGYFPWNPKRFLEHRFVRHELYVDKNGNAIDELDSKSGVINNLLDTVRLNVKILNDAGFNGDVFAIKLNKYSTAAAPQNQVENDRRKRVRALATGKLTSNRLHQVTGGGAISTEEVQIADEYTQLMADYNAKKKGHVRLEKQFKLQTEGEAILGSVGGKEHVDKIRANAKLTKVLQYGYGEDYKKYVRQPFDKKFASDALISLNTKKAWPGIIEDPGCFDESPPRYPVMGKPNLPVSAKRQSKL